MKFLFFSLTVVLFTQSCTTVKNMPAIKGNLLPSRDSFKTADLFNLPPDKQLLYFQNIDRILPTNKIEAGKKKYPLIEAYKDFSQLSFTYKDSIRTLQDFMHASNVVGLIVVKNDSILLEQYREGTGPFTKWINFSVSKSVTSLLYGAALKDGHIKTLEEKVTTYIPELAGSEYDSVSLRNLLQMSSGVAWNDDTRDPQSDIIQIGRMEKSQGWAGVVSYLSALKRIAPPGKKFNYNTMETNLAGIILKNIIHKPLAEYLSEKLWRPFGMHADGNWVISKHVDVELGGCCISATLRDYALLGVFASRNGVSLGGNQILPASWMKESITPGPSYKGYGYYWWLSPSGRYFASGAFGQQIEIDSLHKTIIAVQSHWPVAFNDYYVNYMDSAMEAIINSLK